MCYLICSFKNNGLQVDDEFKRGLTSIEDDIHGRDSQKVHKFQETVKRVQDMVVGNRHVTQKGRP